MPTDLIIAITSDLHCKSTASEYKETYLYSSSSRLPAEQHPVQSLIKLIENNTIKADILMCPGDITDKMDVTGLNVGWAFLEEIKQVLGASELIATVGNHDVDSYNKLKGTNFDDKIRRLSTKFPIDNSSLNTKFFGDNYFIVEYDKVLILNINTCFNHINTTNAHKSIIPHDLLAKIETELANYKVANKFKITLLHHHPVKLANLDELYKDEDSVENGNLLLDLLRKNKFNLVIHGHKHIPSIENKNGLAIFCAGSFASLANIHDFSAKNTFHIIHLQNIDLKGNLYKVGKIQTWEFRFSKGWVIDEKNYFSPNIGFGLSIDIPNLVNETVKWFNKSGNPILKFDEYIKEFPEVEYLIPIEQEELINELKMNHQIQFHPSLIFNPIRLIKIDI